MGAVGAGAGAAPAVGDVVAAAAAGSVGRCPWRRGSGNGRPMVGEEGCIKWHGSAYLSMGFHRGDDLRSPWTRDEQERHPLLEQECFWVCSDERRKELSATGSNGHAYLSLLDVAFYRCVNTERHFLKALGTERKGTKILYFSRHGQNVFKKAASLPVCSQTRFV